MANKTSTANLILTSLQVLLLVFIAGTLIVNHFDRKINDSVDYKMAMKRFKNPAHAVTFIAICKHFKYPPEVGLALCKIESEFYQYACSDAIARGYFQIMLPTAKEVGGKYNIQILNKWSVYDSANNIWLGIATSLGNVKYHGFHKGIEIYNVGDGNYFAGVRNEDYVLSFKKELASIEMEKKEMIKIYKKSLISNLLKGE